MRRRVMLGALAGLLAGCGKPVAPTDARTVRTAVIGGMTSTGLWQEISRRFEKNTGMNVTLVATGERETVGAALRAGQVDLISMHSGDITTNLVADGFGASLRPWARNELIIMGPPADPAGIRGTHDGAAALRKIAETRSPYLDFHGIGSRETAHNLWKQAGLPNPQGDWMLKDESTDKWSALKFAQEHGAYVITGHIPVQIGKLPASGLEIMVQGDEAMRKPFMVMEANPARFPQANLAGARALAEYLLSPEIQGLLATWGAKDYGGVPLFFPVVLAPPPR